MSEKRYYVVGTKLYMFYDEGKIAYYRITKVDKEADKYTVKVVYPYDLAGMTHLYSCEYVHEKFTKLNPDAYINFILTDDSPRDVMVCLHRTIKDGSINELECEEMPYAICRQDVVNIFKMAQEETPQKGQIWSGISISKDTCPADMPLENFLMTKGFKQLYPVAVYLEDRLCDILELVWKDKFDGALDARARKHERAQDNILDNCHTLEELLRKQCFMYDFHNAFNIIEIPFIPQENGATDDLLRDIIGQLKHVVADKIMICKFDRQINFDELANPFIFMTPDSAKAKPEDQVVWVIGYTIDETQIYIEKRYGTTDKDEIVKKMGFKDFTDEQRKKIQDEGFTIM